MNKADLGGFQTLPDSLPHQFFASFNFFKFLTLYENFNLLQHISCISPMQNSKRAETFNLEVRQDNRSTLLLGGDKKWKGSDTVAEGASEPPDQIRHREKRARAHAATISFILAY